MITINFLAVAVAALGSIVLGSLWYGPLFGKKWISLMGWNSMTPEQMAEGKKTMMRSYIGTFISSFVMAYVMSYVVAAFGSMDAVAGAFSGFWIWLGFVGTISLGNVLWDGKPMGLWLLNNGYNLLNLCYMGALLAVWR